MVFVQVLVADPVEDEEEGSLHRHQEVQLGHHLVDRGDGGVETQFCGEAVQEEKAWADHEDHEEVVP
jgi:hypothetical protein